MWVSLNNFARYFVIFKSSYRQNNALPLKCFNCQKYSHSNAIKKTVSPSADSVQDKILYNSLTSPKHYLDVFKQKREAFNNRTRRRVSNNPVALSLIYSDKSKVLDNKYESSVESKESCDSEPILPFKYSVDCDVNETYTVKDERERAIAEGVNSESMYIDDAIKGAKSWMNDYEKYCEVDSEVDSETNDWAVNYGTPDPDFPISNVACGGCGAYLHCQEPSLPGYLPSEIFSECTKSDLKSLVCQRCHFLKNYNTALSVHVNPDKYVELISRIKPEALVVLMVDLTDTSGSVWPQITDIIGENRPLFLVGNKVDLLWGDRPDWLRHVETVLRNSVPSKTNVIGSSLISAKTGFGVEELVSKLHIVWRSKNDVYLVGCTNVGKSTLFNALIQSDYCKTKAVDLVQRATTAPWPGTTLNLLKFPILRPSGWKLAVRNARLRKEKSRTRMESELRKLQIKVQRKRPVTPPQLLGNIVHSFKSRPEEEDKPDLFNLPPTNVRNSDAEDHRISLVNSHFSEFEQSRWVYDTPGVLHRDQILNILTAEELLLTIPKDLIAPRTFLLYKGMTLLIAGLARVDYSQGERGVKVTVFCSNRLPVTVCKTQDCNDVYTELLGSDMMLVPQGPLSRIREWPGLAASDPVTLCGVDSDQSCADITFPTTGWISVTPEKNEICKFIAWSPMKRGISVRHPPLLPFAVKLRGKKMSRSPAYSKSRTY